MNYKITIFSFLFTLLLILYPIQSASPNLSQDITYHWKKEISIKEVNIPIEIVVPTTLTIDGLPDSSKPGDLITTEISSQLADGAIMKVGDNAYDIDNVLSSSVQFFHEVDLSTLKPLLEEILTEIISVELGIDQERAEEFSSILTDYTHLTLKNTLEIESEIEGGASIDPRVIPFWFDQKTKGTITIYNTATDNISIIYTCYWSMILSIDFADTVYEDSLVAPLINQLSKLIGLPFEKDLGRIKGDPPISHTITIYSLPSLSRTQIMLIVLVIIIICIIALLLILKYPRKPKWQ